MQQHEQRRSLCRRSAERKVIFDKPKSISAYKTRSKLSKEQVQQIFQLRLHKGTGEGPDRITSFRIARRLGVSEKAIRDIWSGRTWRLETNELLGDCDGVALIRAMRRPGQPFRRYPSDSTAPSGISDACHTACASEDENTSSVVSSSISIDTPHDDSFCTSHAPSSSSEGSCSLPSRFRSLPAALSPAAAAVPRAGDPEAPARSRSEGPTQCPDLVPPHWKASCKAPRRGITKPCPPAAASPGWDAPLPLLSSSHPDDPFHDDWPFPWG
mmetsp:Transcript_20047/g.55597  ORF Transcript_20047/g.55597 Transcript_20047/m.55597 type:complete len:270 (-) Transcript_20047:19-828(-)